MVGSQFLRGLQRDSVAGYAIPLYGGLIAVAELCFSFLDSVAGAALYAVILLVMLTDTAARGIRTGLGNGAAQVDETRAIVALAFLPVVRLVSITAPAAAASPAGQHLIVALLLLASVGWGVWGVGLPLASLRPRSEVRQVAVVALAAPLMLIAHYVVRPASLSDGTRWTQLAVAAVAVCAAAVVEELIFRGFIQQAFAGLYGSAVAPLLATAVYAIAYIGVRPSLLIPYAVVIGLLFGWIVERSHSLFGVTVSHSLVNIGVLVVLPSSRHVSG